MTTISFPLFFFNYVTQEEPFPCLPLDYESRCPVSYWAVLPEAKKPPERNNVDVRLTDRELTLIKQWEIHFQRKEAACGDKMTLKYEAEGTAVHTRQDAPEMPCLYSHT